MKALKNASCLLVPQYNRERGGRVKDWGLFLICIILDSGFLDECTSVGVSPPFLCLLSNEIFMETSIKALFNREKKKRNG